MTLPLENLEPRRLLTSLTLITHGYNSDTTGWVSTAATDIQARDGGTSASSIYTMTVAARSGKLKVTDVSADSGQKDWTTTSRGDLILKLDWGSVSTGTYTTQDVASVVYDYMTAGHGDTPALANLPIHLIGHSRGASLMTALAQDLGKSGIWVDQQTNLDPHPVSGSNSLYGISFGDQAMATYDNVAFADTYWRTNGDNNSLDFNGQPVTGSYNSELTSVQNDFIVSAHEAVTAYYIGTINTSTLNGGEEPILPAWYKGTKTAPARDATGFYYSTIAGGDRAPSGTSVLIGGNGKRTAAGESGDQWANAFGLNTRHVTSVTAGQSLTAQFYVQDRDGKARVNVFADSDRNPYDGGTTQLTGKSFSATDLATGKVSVPTGSLKAGSYYLAVEATDSAGHTRWDYTTYQVKVGTPNFAKLANGVLTVTGTAGNDVVTMAQTASTITATLDGASQSFTASSVHSVNVQLGAGNDRFDGTAMTDDLYVFGSTGRDTITGGSGDDTLSGGAQSNVLVGYTGDDVLNGSAGNDSMDGQGGNDRLYGNGGQDTYSGGSNVDRMFGGDGDDLMYGGKGNDKMYGNGGNDTLVGGANVDILNGGSGTNTSDNDPLDLRTDIQNVLSNL